jgi:hypothetical protein
MQSETIFFALLQPMKKVKKQKRYFDTFNWSFMQSETIFFALTQSKKSLSAYSAQTPTKIFAQKNFCFRPQSRLPREAVWDKKWREAKRPKFSHLDSGHL